MKKKKDYSKDAGHPVARGIMPQQVRFIKTAQSKLKLDDGTYRAILWQLFKKKSCTVLTYLQAEKLKAHLKKLGFKPHRVRSQPARQVAGTITKRHKGITYLVSPRQWGEITRLVPLLSWTDESLKSFCTNKFGFPRPRNMRQASQLISSMYGILQQDSPAG